MAGALFSADQNLADALTIGATYSSESILMTTFTLQRTVWLQQVSRPSRNFAANLSTSASRKQRLGIQFSEAPHEPVPYIISPLNRCKASQELQRIGQTRRRFSSTSIYGEQSAQQANESEVPNFVYKNEWHVWLTGDTGWYC